MSKTFFFLSLLIASTVGPVAKAQATNRCIRAEQSADSVANTINKLVRELTDDHSNLSYSPQVKIKHDILFKNKIDSAGGSHQESGPIRIKISESCTIDYWIFYNGKSKRNILFKKGLSFPLLDLYNIYYSYKDSFPSDTPPVGMGNMGIYDMTKKAGINLSYTNKCTLGELEKASRENADLPFVISITAPAKAKECNPESDVEVISIEQHQAAQSRGV